MPIEEDVTAARRAMLPTPSRNGKAGGGGGAHETPEHGGGGGGVEGSLENIAEEATLGAELLVQCHKTPALSVTDPSREHERLDKPVEGASRIAGMHLPKASPGALQFAFDPMLKTPAHSRDRDGLQWDPPRVGLRATGEVSRRIRRDKHRPINNNSSSARGKSARGGVSVPSADASSCAKTTTATIPSSQVPPVKNSAERVEKKPDIAPRINRKPGPKKFSYASDTTWLRRKEETPETTPALRELGVGVTAEAKSSSPVGRLPSPESAGVSSPDTGATWGVGGVVPSATVEGERYQPPSDADEPFEQGLAAVAGTEEEDAGTVVFCVVRSRMQVQIHWTV